MPFMPWQRGEPITAMKLNEMFKAWFRSIVGGPGIVVEQSGDQIVISAQSQYSGNMHQYGFARVNTIYDDYVKCNVYDPILNQYLTQTVIIAKPYALRKAPYDGETVAYPNGDSVTYTWSTENAYTRTATDGTITETQVITPIYATGEIIRVIAGNTGVSDSDSNPVVWEDLNTCGRHWARTA